MFPLFSTLDALQNGQSLAEVSARMGADYLAQHFHRITDSLHLCLVTHALHVSQHDAAADAFEVMRGKARIGDEIKY